MSWRTARDDRRASHHTCSIAPIHVSSVGCEELSCRLQLTLDAPERRLLVEAPHSLADRRCRPCQARNWGGHHHMGTLEEAAHDEAGVSDRRVAMQKRGNDAPGR